MWLKFFFMWFYPLNPLSFLWLWESNLYLLIRKLKVECTQCPTVRKIYGVLSRHALRVAVTLKPQSTIVLYRGQRKKLSKSQHTAYSTWCVDSKMAISALTSRGSFYMQYKHVLMQGGRDNENPNVYVCPKHCHFLGLHF